MSKTTRSNPLLLLLLALVSLLLPLGMVGCASGNIGEEGSCAGFTCRENQGYRGDQGYGSEAEKAWNIRQTEEARKAREAEKAKRDADFESFRNSRVFEQTGGQVSNEAHCCLNGQFFDCPSAEAARICFEDFAPGECSPDSNRNDECS